MNSRRFARSSVKPPAAVHLHERVEGLVTPVREHPLLLHKIAVAQDRQDVRTPMTRLVLAGLQRGGDQLLQRLQELPLRHLRVHVDTDVRRPSRAARPAFSSGGSCSA